MKLPLIFCPNEKGVFWPTLFDLKQGILAEGKMISMLGLSVLISLDQLIFILKK
jgi:hypothetical protein